MIYVNMIPMLFLSVTCTWQVTTILMCNLIILAVRMPLWIKLKELWTESEKHFLAKKIKASSGCVQEGDISLKSCIISACEVTRKLATLDKTYREKKISNISLIKDEFAFAFLEGKYITVNLFNQVIGVLPNWVFEIIYRYYQKMSGNIQITWSYLLNETYR